MIVLLWLVFLAFQVAKAHVQKCSKQYWLLFGSQVTMLLAATAAIVWIQYRQLSNDAPRLSPEIRILIGGNDGDGKPHFYRCRYAFPILPVNVIKVVRQQYTHA